MPILYQTENGPLVSADGALYPTSEDWDTLFNRDDLAAHLAETVKTATPFSGSLDDAGLLPPIGSQEVWAAGVTYYRSRDARMEESRDAGGGDFYDRVYDAPRPELFLKATPHRVVGHGGQVRIRGDSKWNVPEPELTLAITRNGKIIGYTCGNDMSSRDIEGENPLYLPQAKVYDRSAGLGPGVLVTDGGLSDETVIRLEIRRAGDAVFDGSTTLSQLKRSPEELVGYLYRDNVFPNGAFLMTGTGVVPPNEFTLRSADEISIDIQSIGTLTNTVL